MSALRECVCWRLRECVECAGVVAQILEEAIATRELGAFASWLHELFQDEDEAQDLAGDEACRALEGLRDLVWLLVPHNEASQIGHARWAWRWLNGEGGN